QPRSSMNSSGLAVGRLVGYFKTALEDLLVIHDDLDLELGSFKLQKGRGAAGHRGVESIITALGSSDFWRLRVGIGRPTEGTPAEDYVLEKFGEEEWGVIVKLVEEKLIGVIEEWVGENVK
ncbi:aminoacyl-tRNA hydrolase, partial [Candidatus Parcubacteria bacterium]|nr:aminoacyl-tRNA hydrolase [Candidatus Parcubacteria bacterium]